MTDETIKLPRFTRGQVQRASHLLDMLYKPSEIADELGIAVRTIYRVHVSAGCPNRKDEGENIWIPGKKYAAWVSSIARGSTAQKTPMEHDQAYCVRCRHRVPLLSETSEKAKHSKGAIKISGICGECGGQVVKFARAGVE